MGRELWGLLLALRRFWRRRRGLTHQNSMIEFFKSYSATLASLPALLDTGNEDPHSVQQEGPPPLPHIISFITSYILNNFKYE
jgi:hypothetical protein